MTAAKHLTVFLWLLIAIHGFSQQQILPVALTSRLESVRMCPGNERHFAELYLQTTHLSDLYIESLPAEGRSLMKRLEERFAIYFFRAIDSNNRCGDVPGEWKNYFNGNYSPLQLKLMGANAHINGDIWRALSENFSPEEIRELSPFYKRYDQSIKNIFDDLFKKGIRSHKRLHDLHVVTLGLDKVYGRMLLKKWRNRQLRLAILKLGNKQKFNALKKRIDKKRTRIDKMIIRRLHVKE